MDWYVKVLRNYTVFEGRARRKEYWYFFLFNLLISMGLALIDSVTGTLDPNVGLGLLGKLYALAVLLPAIAVAVRRLHDTGRPGWWLLLALIPFIGPLVLLVFFVQDSQPGTNQFGDNPKSAGEPTG